MKIVVITGADKGFGKALAKAFIKEKATVIISSNTPEALKHSASQLGVDYQQADVTSYQDMVSLADKVVSKYGQIDVWINNAGVQIAPSLVEAVDIEKLHNLFEVNFFGYFYGCMVALKVMKRQSRGLIINVNSTAGISGKPNLSAYVSSKFAIKGLSETIRQEIKDLDIELYQVFPGGMQTDIYKEMVPADFQDYMLVDDVVKKVMANLNLDRPNPDLVLKRP